MAYPPTVPSGARINTTPQVDLHPADHLEIHAALTDIVTVLGSDPAGDAADVTARFALEVPVGVILPYGGSSAPSGWALCTGTAVSRSSYATLFGIIGTAFGVGDGSTTFNLPDFQNRYPIGDSGTLTLGGAVGSNDAVVVTHVHTMPSHDHSINPPSTTSSSDSHTHLSQGLGYLYRDTTYANQQSTVTPVGSGGPYAVNFHVDTEADAHTHTTDIASFNSENVDPGDTNSAGVSGTNANRPESVPVNYIIRLT